MARKSRTSGTTPAQTRSYLHLAARHRAHLSMKYGVHPYFIMRETTAQRVSGTAASWTVPDLCAAYQWPTSLDGGGVIAIVELGGGWIQSDVDQYFQEANLPSPHITDISVDGTKNSGGVIQSDADAEVALDIQVAAATYAVASGKAATVPGCTRPRTSRRQFGKPLLTAAMFVGSSWGADRGTMGRRRRTGSGAGRYRRHRCWNDCLLRSG